MLLLLLLLLRRLQVLLIQTNLTLTQVGKKHPTEPTHLDRFLSLGVTAVKTMLSASRKSLSGLMDKTSGDQVPTLVPLLWRCFMDVLW